LFKWLILLLFGCYHFLELSFSSFLASFFEGWEIQGVTVLTISQGEVVWEASVQNGLADWRKGTFSVVKGRGRYLERPTFGPPYEGLKNRLSHTTRKPVDRKN